MQTPDAQLHMNAHCETTGEVLDTQPGLSVRVCLPAVVEQELASRPWQAPPHVEFGVRPFDTSPARPLLSYLLDRCMLTRAPD